jgi:hypothetical protein
MLIGSWACFKFFCDVAVNLYCPANRSNFIHCRNEIHEKCCLTEVALYRLLGQWRDFDFLSTQHLLPDVAVHRYYGGTNLDPRWLHGRRIHRLRRSGWRDGKQHAMGRYLSYSKRRSAARAGPVLHEWTTDEYYYVTNTGRLKRICELWSLPDPPPTPQNLSNDRDVGISFGSSGTSTDSKGCTVEYQQFYVGTKAHIWTGYHSRDFSQYLRDHPVCP